MAFMKTFVSLFMISLIMAAVSETMARELPVKPTQTLAARLKAEGGEGLGDCWSALLELKSCTNEIVIFFLDGEMYLGQECCKAIRIITRHCWPSMLTSLGLTAQEGDILRGYCDATTAPAPSGPAPAQAPSALIPVVLGKKN